MADIKKQIDEYLDTLQNTVSSEGKAVLRYAVERMQNVSEAIAMTEAVVGVPPTAEDIMAVLAVERNNIAGYRAERTVAAADMTDDETREAVRKILSILFQAAITAAMSA